MQTSTYHPQLVNQSVGNAWPSGIYSAPKADLSQKVEDGMYIVRRRATLLPGKNHYGIAVVGRFAQDLYPWINHSVVLHKTNQFGRHCDIFNSCEWELVEEIPRRDIVKVVDRVIASWYEPYDLFLDNCEHWVRYAATDVKESFEVQGFVKFIIAAGSIAYLISRDDS